MPKQFNTIDGETLTLKRKDTELNALFKRLYEDNVLGKISNKVFRKHSDDYLLEQKEIQSSIPKKKRNWKNSRIRLQVWGIFRKSKSIY